MNRMNKTIRNTAWLLAGLALAVVALGAFVRLSHAGLGCPDWPVCYGKTTWPVAEADIATANEAFPDRPVEVAKAWKEQVHRFLAAALGLGVWLLALWTHRRSRRGLVAMVGSAIAASAGIAAYVSGSIGLSIGLAALAFAAPILGTPRRERDQLPSAALLSLIIFQAMLGMWTVALLLKPIIVTAHLMGGLATLGLLVWMGARNTVESSPVKSAVSRAGWIAFAVLVIQLLLGGWTSTNYAALSCPDFPTCQSQWWPDTDVVEAFTLWRGVGVDYEGGVLDADARATIHWFHRLGAIAATFAIGWFLLLLTRARVATGWAHACAVALVAQIGLGISNVVAGLPLAVAVAHNAMAAILLSLMIVLLTRIRSA